MRKSVLIFLTPLLLCSCFTPLKIIPIKGHYIETPFQVQSERTREEVWSNIIDFFGQKGIGIKIIDKNSWLIISDAYNMSYTYEDSKGKLIDPNAFLVIRKKLAPGNVMGALGGGTMNPESVSAEWNVILKEQQGKAVININIVNPRFIEYGSYQKIEFTPGGCYSTGVFENRLSEILK